MYGRNAIHLYMAPGLALQAALNMTGVILALLTDLDMHLFVKKGAQMTLMFCNDLHFLILSGICHVLL